MKRNFVRFIAIVLSILLMLDSNAVEALASGLNDGKSNVNVSNQQTYEEEGYSVTFTVTSKWKNGYNASVRIDNTGLIDIENWSLKLDYNVDIINMWNAGFSKEKDGSLIVKNVEWNQDIPVGRNVEFGFSVKEEFNGFPVSCQLIGSKNDVQKEAYDVEYKVTSDWGNGYTSDVIIKNNTDKTIEDWVLEFDFDRDITSIWNAVIEEHLGNHYVIKNAGHNSNIKADGQISFGFIGDSGKKDDVPANYSLYSYGDSLNIISIDLDNIETEDARYLLYSDFEGFKGHLNRSHEVDSFTITVYDKNDDTIFTSDIVPNENWSSDDLAVIYGENTIIFRASIGNNVDEKKINVCAKENINFDRLMLDDCDNDGDGLANYFEKYFGTDPELADTDGDGLSDFIELYYLGTDPLKRDTDGNGVNDGDEDEDEDGLSNLYEVEIGSDCTDIDSDNDGLEDGIEISFGTSPVLTDTDDNGVTDYEEYYFANNNIEYNPDTGMYTAVFEGKEVMSVYDEAVIPSVKITADKEGILSFVMEMQSSSFIINPNMSGYMGAAYDFHTSGNIVSAELTFTYDEALIDSAMLASEDFCPTIYFYDNETQQLVEIENQKWEGNTVTVSLPHFSIYLLVNKADLIRLWNSVMDEDDEKVTIAHDVVFVIDKSGSMQTSDSQNIRASLINDFCKKIGGNDKVGLVGFANSKYVYTSDLTGKYSELESAIQSFKRQSDYGGTYMNEGIYAAVGLLDRELNTNVQKTIFCLTDGDTFDTVSNNYLDSLKQKGITLYTVGLGSVNETYLRRIAQYTGGEYFYAKTSADLKEVFIDFEDEIFTDENNDKLDDNLTRLICQGKITTYTGTRVFCSEVNEDGWEEMYEEIMKNNDFDEDGIINGDEIEVYEINGKTYIRINTSPETGDTDFDGYDDYEERYVYGTDPQTPNYLIKYDDRTYVNSKMNFESGKAYDEYISRSSFSLVTEFLFNVIICGGTASLEKKTRMQLLNLFVEYADQNLDRLEVDSMADNGNSIVRFIFDTGGLYMNGQRVVWTKEIEDLRKILNSNAKVQKGIVKKTIEALGSKIELGEKNWKKISDFGTEIGILFTIVSWSSESIEYYCEYDAALRAVSEYKYILNELKYCNNENVCDAAKKAYIDMEAEFEKINTYYEDVRASFLMDGSLSASSIIIGSAGLPGVIIDLVWLVSDIVVGSTIDDKIVNYLNINIVEAIKSVSERIISNNSVTGKNGISYYLSTGESAVNRIQNLYPFYVFSRLWSEQEYLKMYNSNTYAKSNVVSLDAILRHYLSEVYE